MELFHATRGADVVIVVLTMHVGDSVLPTAATKLRLQSDSEVKELSDESREGSPSR